MIQPRALFAAPCRSQSCETRIALINPNTIMKKESEFLPVPMWWRQEKPSRRVERAFVWGMVTGTVLSLLVSLLISLL